MESHTESQTTSAVPDIDIHDEVNNVITRYPPLAADRHQIRVLVNNGIVYVGGHVKSRPSARYLLDAIARINGVRGVNGNALYDEETLRIEVGRVLPVGVLANTRYGTVILSGRLPEGVTHDDLAARLSTIPGVERVVSNF